MKTCLNVICNVSLIIGLTCTAHAQQMDYCGFEQAVDQMEQQYPGYQEAIDYTIERAKSRGNTSTRSGSTNDSILRIPVVFHVVHENQSENLHDSLILSQIEVLNRAFRRKNPDTVETRPVFDSLAGDARIEFYLANKDPNGDLTTGITRTKTTKSSFFSLAGGVSGIDEIKSDADGGKSPWPTDKYLNIWIGDLSVVGTPGVLGFAYPPMGAPDSMWPAGQLPNDSSVAGVVVHYEAFGRNNPLATGPQLSRTDEGGTAVHEVGHYLGLRHISGDGDCSADDYIDDTPIQNGGQGGIGQGSGHHQTCAYGTNTCVDTIDTPFDYPDMFDNYMDYAPDSCTNLFTQDQIDLMRTMVIDERSDLYESDTATPLPRARFKLTDTNVCKGEAVKLVNKSTNASSFKWQTSNATFLYESIINPNIVFDSSGTYSIKLIANNIAGSDTSVLSYQVDATEPPQVAFNSSDTVLTLPNAEVNFNNQSSNGTTYIWDFGNGNTSQMEEPTHEYTESGDYDVTLTVKNDICPEKSVTRSDYIRVKESSAIQASQNLSHFAVNPNPVKEQGVLSVKFNAPQQISIKIVDLLGRTNEVVSDRQFDAGEHKISLASHLSTIPQGVFMVKLSGDSIADQIKVIKR